MNANQVEAWRYMIGGALIGVSAFSAVVLTVLLVWFVRHLVRGKR